MSKNSDHRINLMRERKELGRPVQPDDVPLVKMPVEISIHHGAVGTSQWDCRLTRHWPVAEVERLDRSSVWQVSAELQVGLHTPMHSSWLLQRQGFLSCPDESMHRTENLVSVVQQRNLADSSLVDSRRWVVVVVAQCYRLQPVTRSVDRRHRKSPELLGCRETEGAQMQPGMELVPLSSSS